jgi:hypothetical protein
MDTHTPLSCSPHTQAPSCWPDLPEPLLLAVAARLPRAGDRRAARAACRAWAAALAHTFGSLSVDAADFPAEGPSPGTAAASLSRIGRYAATAALRLPGGAAPPLPPGVLTAALGALLTGRPRLRRLTIEEAPSLTTSSGIGAPPAPAASINGDIRRERLAASRRASAWCAAADALAAAWPRLMPLAAAAPPLRLELRAATTPLPVACLELVTGLPGLQALSVPAAAAAAPGCGARGVMADGLRALFGAGALEDLELDVHENILEHVSAWGTSPERKTNLCTVGVGSYTRILIVCTVLGLHPAPRQRCFATAHSTVARGRLPWHGRPCL